MPTGMKMGVCIVPCAVSICPARAAEALSVCCNLNFKIRPILKMSYNNALSKAISLLITVMFLFLLNRDIQRVLHLFFRQGKVEYLSDILNKVELQSF